MSTYTDAEIDGLLAESQRLPNRSWYEIRERQHTDVDELARRAEQLCAEAQAILQRERARRDEQEAARRAREEEAWHYVAEDLRSTNEGQRLGRQYGHDAFRLARGLGLEVQYVPVGQLQNKKRPSVTILGRHLPGFPIVQLADGLKGFQLHHVLAHECAHALDFPDERLCEQFADHFLRISDDELRGRARRR